MIRWWIAVLFSRSYLSRQLRISGDGEQSGSFFGDVSNYFAGSGRGGIRDVTAVSGLCTPARAFVKRVLQRAARALETRRVDRVEVKVACDMLQTIG